MYSSSACVLGTLAVIAVAAAAAPAVSQEKQQCPSIKAADGSCADPRLVEAANRRAAIVSSQSTSYLGTPLGSVGMPFIPQERLFRDDPTLFGLPTTKTEFIIGPAQVIIRSK
jgi:hypothetical protein